jgi:hypothetical protein
MDTRQIEKQIWELRAEETRVRARIDELMVARRHSERVEPTMRPWQPLGTGIPSTNELEGGWDAFTGGAGNSAGIRTYRIHAAGRIPYTRTAA